MVNRSTRTGKVDSNLRWGVSKNRDAPIVHVSPEPVVSLRVVLSQVNAPAALRITCKLTSCHLGLYRPWPIVKLLKHTKPGFTVWAGTAEVFVKWLVVVAIDRRYVYVITLGIQPELD